MNELMNVTVVSHAESDTTVTVINNSTFVNNSSYPTNVQVNDSAKTVIAVGETTVKVTSSLIGPQGIKGDVGVADYEELTNKPVLGTASTLDYNQSQNALPNQVVTGNDTRLSDNRNPLPHSHYIEDIKNLTNSIDSVVRALASVSSCWGSFSGDVFSDYQNEYTNLSFTVNQQSNNTNILNFSEYENAIIINGSCKAVFLGVFSGEASTLSKVKVDLINYDTEELVGSFIETVDAGQFYFSDSIQFESLVFLSSTKLKIRISIIEGVLLNFSVIDFTVIVNALQNFDSNSNTFSLTTTNPMLITNGLAEIGHYVNNGVVMNSAIVFLDLSENDFDNSGKLLYNRDYLVEDHFGVTVIGSKLQLPLHLDGKYAVVSYVK